MASGVGISGSAADQAVARAAEEATGAEVVEAMEAGVAEAREAEVVEEVTAVEVVGATEAAAVAVEVAATGVVMGPMPATAVPQRAPFPTHPRTTALAVSIRRRSGAASPRMRGETRVFAKTARKRKTKTTEVCRRSGMRCVTKSASALRTDGSAGSSSIHRTLRSPQELHSIMSSKICRRCHPCSLTAL
jgi:hypothetical protein